MLQLDWDEGDLRKHALSLIEINQCGFDYGMKKKIN